MKTRHPLLSGACLLAIFGAGAAMAQEEPFEASVAVGYVRTSGNTDTSTFNSEILATLRTENWQHEGKLQSLGSQENDVTTAERYYAEEKSEFNITDRDYLFGKGSYNDDRFSGYEYQAAVSGGIGRYFIRNDTFTLEAFVGGGYRRSEIVLGGEEEEAIATVGENSEWQISENAALVQSLTSDIGDELALTRFELGLTSDIIAGIATKISFIARHTSEVPVGNKKTDTQTSVSLVYKF